MTDSIQEVVATMNKTAAELVEDLGWTQNDPRSAYDLAVFRVLQALVEELRVTRQEIEDLREGTS